jgi:hypothetical protein
MRVTLIYILREVTMNPDIIKCHICKWQFPKKDVIFPCNCEESEKEGIVLCKRDWDSKYPPSQSKYTCKFCGETKKYETRRVISREKMWMVYLVSTIVVDIIAISILAFVTSFNGDWKLYFICSLIYTIPSMVIFVFIDAIHRDLTRDDPNALLTKLFRNPGTETFSFVYRLAIYILMLIVVVCTMLLGAFCRVYIMNYSHRQEAVLSIANLKTGGVAVAVLVGVSVVVPTIIYCIYKGIFMLTDSEVRFIQMEEEV